MDILFYFSGVSLAFIIFQLLFPYKPKNNADFSLLKRNAKRYNQLELWAIFWIFLFVAYIAFCVVFLGSQMQKHFFSQAYAYLIQPTFSFWFFPGLILGFGLVGIPMEFLYKLILKNEYYLYLEFTNLKHGWDGKKIWKPFSVSLVVAGVIVFYMGLTWYVRIDNENRIEINDLTTLKTVNYNLSDISAIIYSEKYHTKKGVEKSIAHYRIVMNDGYMYSSHEHAFFSLQEDHDKLKEKMEELSTNTGVTIRTIP
jgi:hypothetical protein